LAASPRESAAVGASPRGRILRSNRLATRKSWPELKRIADGGVASPTIANSCLGPTPGPVLRGIARRGHQLLRFGSVSTIAVLFRRLASSTGINSPVLASRPIFLVLDCLVAAISVLLRLREHSSRPFRHFSRRSISCRSWSQQRSTSIILPCPVARACCSSVDWTTHGFEVVACDLGTSSSTAFITARLSP